VEVRCTEDALRAAVDKVAGASLRWVRAGDGSVAGASYEGVGVLEACVQSEADVREGVARALVESGIGLLGLRPAEVELESIFVQLTKTKEAA
jgi:hypothetical protein